MLRIHGSTVTLALLAIVGLLCSAGAVHAAGLPFDERAWRVHAAQDPLSAIEIMRERIQSEASPAQKARGYALLGALLSEDLGDVQSGIDNYRAALALDHDGPQAEDIRYSLALALISAGQYSAASKELRSILDRRPDHPLAFSMQATLEDLRGRPDRPAAKKPAKFTAKELPKRSILPSPSEPVRQERPPEQPSQQLIRVLIWRGYSLEVTSDGTVFVFGADAKQLGAAANRLVCVPGEAKVECLDSGDEVLQLIPAKGRLLFVEGRPFRGALILRLEQDRLIAVNRLGIESYLYGVLPKEVPFEWPLEALKAQAVAARTYAYSQMSRATGLPYDVESTVMSQVYGGLAAERPSTTKAVDETRDEVMRYAGQVAVAYFHSHSGGRTEDPAFVWGARLPYLVSQDDPYSLQSGTMAWKTSYSLDEVREKLGKEYAYIGAVTDLKVSRRNGARAEMIKVAGTRSSATLSANRLRLLLGAARLKSTAFSLEKKGKSFVFAGKGYGHGVGMSQWGAMAMAGKGMDYRKILSFYYRGVSIDRITPRP